MEGSWEFWCGSVWVVADGKEGALGDGFGGAEFAGVDLVVYEVVVGDAEVFVVGMPKARARPAPAS